MRTLQNGILTDILENFDTQEEAQFFVQVLLEIARETADKF